MVHEVNPDGGVEAIPPLFYVMARGLETKHHDAICNALFLTPCQAVVISDLADAEAAWKFAPMVMRADSEFMALTVAREWAQRTGRPLLVIGKAEFFDAVYRDGHTESVRTDLPTDA
jgi:hypothetical protein